MSVGGKVVLRLGFEETFEGVEVHGFELAEALHPDRGGAQSVGFEFAPVDPATLFLADQTGRRECGEVFGDGGERHPEGLGNIGDGHVVFQQQGQDRPAGRVGKGREYNVERGGHGGSIAGLWPMVNRMVEYGEACLRRFRVVFLAGCGGVKVFYIRWLIRGRGALSLLDSGPATP